MAVKPKDFEFMSEILPLQQVEFYEANVSVSGTIGGAQSRTFNGTPITSSVKNPIVQYAYRVNRNESSFPLRMLKRTGDIVYGFNIYLNNSYFLTPGARVSGNTITPYIEVSRGDGGSTSTITSETYKIYIWVLAPTI